MIASGSLRRSRGIALILVSGVVVVLALSASLFLQMVLFQGRSQGRSLSLRQAELAAGSGMDYAAARLTRGEVDMGVPRTPAARGDDWQYRGGGEYRREPGDDFADYPVPEALGETRSPSFGHGEPWEDAAGGLPGIWDAGEPFVDFDGDGAFSAWSGRLRGGEDPWGLRFSLRIEPGPTSRVNVNYGDLSAAWSGAYYGFGTILSGSGKHMARTLNALGVVLGMGTVIEIPSSNLVAGPEYKSVRVSDLGHRVLANRPARSGYRSIDEVRQALSAGASPLTDEEWRILEPNLTLVQYDYGNQAFVLNDLLDYQGASAALLNSHWMYRLGQARSAHLSYDQGGNLILSGSGASEMDPWIGRPFGEVATLFADEIRPIVQGIVERRRTGVFDSFDALYGHALQGMQAWGHAPAGADAAERDFFLARKADLFMGYARRAQMACWVGAAEQLIHPLSWATRALDRNSGVLGDQVESCLANGQVDRNFEIPSTGNAYPGVEPYDLPVADPFGPAMGTLYEGFWFGPIRSFRVACRSASGTRGRTAFQEEEGDFLAGIGLVFRNQEHFENLKSRRDLANPNILPERPTEIERDVFLHDLGRFNGTQSLSWVFPGKSFWRSGIDPLPGNSFGGLDLLVGGVTLAETEESDFAAEPTLRWEFTPDASFDAAGADGPEHARGIGRYPFNDNSPLAPRLFDAGDELIAYSGGQTTNADLAIGMVSTVGVRFNSTAVPQSIALLTATDRGPLTVLGPTVLPDAASRPAPLPMLPFQNSDGTVIDVLVPSPQNEIQTFQNWTYTHHTLQPRWFLEGGFEAWVTQANFTEGVTAPIVRISGGGYQWADNATNPFLRGASPQEVSLEFGPNPSTGQPEYRLVTRCNVPAARVWNNLPVGIFPPRYLLSGNGYLNGTHSIGIPLPVRSGKPPGGHNDHILVEWKVLSVTRYDMLDPEKKDIRHDDQMPRVDVRLRITLNGTEVHEQVHTSRLAYRITDGFIDQNPLGGAPLFDSFVGFFPPMGRCNNGRDSYLHIEMHHCDQVALHSAYRSSPPPPDLKDRYRSSGTYESPRLVFGRGATLRWAGWNAAASRSMRELTVPPVHCDVQGFSDAAGSIASGGAVSVGSLDAPAAWLDAPRCRSARFNVHFSVPTDASSGQVLPGLCDDPMAPSPGPAGGTGAFTDPPVFDEFQLFVTDHPRWLTR